MAEKTCGSCRYFGSEVENDCFANPPVIVEALVVHALKLDACIDVIAAASRRPTTEIDTPACRLFEKRGA